nr:hypothetical protein [Tanacetum cinerariifolium]
MDEDQAGSNPGKCHVALVGPNPKPMHDDFILDDTYTFGDRFFNDKSTKDKPRKLNVDAKVVSMVIVPIHQASTLAPPLSTPIIDLSRPKPVASPLLEPFIVATIETTTTREGEGGWGIIKSQTLNKTTQNLGSRVFTLKLQDLPHKITQTVNEVVKKEVHLDFQASLRDRFRELLEADMKEILHQWMFEIGSYKSLPEHVALYEALEASME